MCTSFDFLERPLLETAQRRDPSGGRIGTTPDEIPVGAKSATLKRHLQSTQCRLRFETGVDAMSTFTRLVTIRRRLTLFEGETSDVETTSHDN